MTEYHTLNDLMELSTQQQKEIWEIVQQAEIDESERTAEESYHKMLQKKWISKNLFIPLQAQISPRQHG